MTVPALKVRLFGIPIEIRASFVVMVVAIGLPTHLSPGLMLGWVAIATVAVLIHEAGHAAAFVWFGDRPRITLHGAGGATLGGHPGARRMVVVSAAGPVAGLVVGLWVALLPPSVAANPIGRQLTGDALFATIGLSLFNLVPLAGLDGHSVLNSLVAAATGRPAGAIGWMLGVATLGAFVGGALWLGRIDVALILAIFVCLHWRSVLGLPDRSNGPGSAARLLNAGRPADALLLADTDLRRGRNVIDALLTRGAALEAMTRYAEADAAFSSVLAQAPGNLRALAGRSDARRRLGIAESADSDLNVLLASEANDVNDISAQFLGLYHAYRYERALDLIRFHLAKPDILPAVADHLRMLEAVVECVLGQAETALGHAQALVARRPDQVALHELVALASLQLGRWQAALDHAKWALAGAPRHPELLETLGIVERLSGQPERAYAHLLEAATQRPDLPVWTADDPFVNYARGCILAASGSYEEAMGRFARAARIRPSLGAIARVDPILAPLFENRGADAQAALPERAGPSILFGAP